MKEKILDYLTLQSLLDRDFQSQPNQRIKAAFILAKKRYEELSEEEKREILKKIESYKK
jgi:hypothetical protein